MDTEITPYDKFMETIGGENIFHYLRALDKGKLKPLLLINAFKKDLSFLNNLTAKAHDEFLSIETKYNELISEYSLQIRLFETNKYYDGNYDQYYLSFWKNENALTDIIVSAMINNENFWRNFYTSLFKLSSEDLVPNVDSLSIKREKALKSKSEDSDSSNGKKGRSDIFVSYLNEQANIECLHIEHKINHELDSDQVELYCKSASEYENISFVLITSKDKDESLISEENGKLFKEITKCYSSKPIIISHVDLIRIFFNTIVNDKNFHYEWVIAWLFEIIKNFRNEEIIRAKIGKAYSNGYNDEIWEKLLLLDILGG